ncbi:hypothetical protein [Rheinheimera sp. 1928-s]|uniref:hypothetical protein n=1 Tax=Rheinheimera sp. 1928-s TaxID=3033803 RepID=UPI002619E4F3|nr:hypothetical protein [Rheinheimera sp. 1928-s]MDF3124665.1 hypothetical protein [Rheinheimera sp. 1928-s]
MRNWLKTILFVSSFSPTLFVIAGVRFYSTCKIDLLAIQLVTISIIGTILPLLIIALLKKESEIYKFKAKKVESADYFLLVFVASYSAPIVMKLAEINAEATTAIISLIFIVSWFISNIPSHPLLYLLKYRFYKVESDDGMVFVLITKRQIRSPSNITSVIRISNGMLME